MGQPWAGHDDICDAAEGCIGNLKVKDLPRQMGDERIWRGEVNPRAGKGYQLADDVVGAEWCVKIVQCGNQWQRLRRRLSERLGIGIEDAEDAIMELVRGNCAGDHIILAMVSSGPCIYSRRLLRDLGHAAPAPATHRGRASTHAAQCRRWARIRPCLPSSPFRGEVSGRGAGMLCREDAALWKKLVTAADYGGVSEAAEGNAAGAREGRGDHGDMGRAASTRRRGCGGGETDVFAT